MSIARRTKAQLVDELVKLTGVVGGGKVYYQLGKEQLCDELRKILAPGCIPNQVNVMLAASSEKYMDMDAGDPWFSSKLVAKFWDNPAVQVEQKLDGVRAKLHFYRDGSGPTSWCVRMDGRNRSTKTYAFSEFTESLPHFTGSFVWHQQLFDGTIIDGELLMPQESIWTGKVQTDSVRYSSIVVTNAGVKVALRVQVENGNCLFFPFDVIQYCGHWCHDKALNGRQNRLAHFLNNNPHPDMRVVPGVEASADRDAKVAFYLSIVMAGGEGVILKDVNAKYEFGKRRECWLKVKKFETVDCFVTDSRPGEHGFEGMVGALEGSVYMPAAAGETRTVEICAVSGFTLADRQEMTSKERPGKVKDKYFGRVMEVRYQEKSKTGRGMHARFVRWRPDKSASDCLLTQDK